MTIEQILWTALIILNALMILVSCAQYSRAKDLETKIDAVVENQIGLNKILLDLIKAMDKKTPSISEVIAKALQDSLQKSLEEDEQANLVD